MTAEKKRPDRRASRTRRSLSDSLVELILEKRYDAITVQNVIDRADVGRSTFYAHYQDKEDLLLSSWEGFFDWFVQHIQWQNISAGRFVPLVHIFQHVQEFHKFYLALVRSRKTDLLFKTGHKYLTRNFEKALGKYLADKPQPSVPLPVLSNHLAGGILDLLKWWLDHGMPYSPERMEEIFHELTMPGFRAALGNVEIAGNKVEIEVERKDAHDIRHKSKAGVRKLRKHSHTA